MLSPLAAADGFRVDAFICPGGERAVEEHNARHEIVFVRRGAFHIESDRGAAFVDAQRVLLLHRGERFRVTHPAGCSDDCLVLGCGEELLAELLEVSGVLEDRRPETPFRSLTLASPPALQLAAERFRARLVAERGDPLIAAEDLLPLVARALGATGDEAPEARRRRGDALVEGVRVEIARRLGERTSLAELGAAVGVSPFHLARLFRRRTGSSIHQYRLELRLREAHGRLLEGERDLTRLALDLGFADHAHFTNAFRTRYGAAPSRFRAPAPARLSAPHPMRRPTGAA